MARRRLEGNSHLPKNVRCRDGYYSWRNPVDDSEYGLGRDKAVALCEAERRNGLVDQRIVLIPGTEITVEQITAGSQPIEMLCAVYFLLSGGEIVYVGQSTNVHLRLANHIADKVIAFDRYYIVPCERALLNTLETQYIIHFRPKYNRTFNPKRVYGVGAV